MHISVYVSVKYYTRLYDEYKLNYIACAILYNKYYCMKVAANINLFL